MALIVVLAACIAAAPWTPPGDGAVSEPQLRIYIDTTRDWQLEYAAADEAYARAQTDAERAAALSDLSEKRKECLERHQISEAEYRWIARQVTEAWTVAGVIEQAGGRQINDPVQLNKQLKAAEARKAKYELALKEGTRMMSADDRAEAVRVAERDEAVAQLEADDFDEEARIEGREAQRHEENATAADALAKDPPSEVVGTLRADFIKQEETEALDERQAESDAFVRQTASLSAVRAAEKREADDRLFSIDPAEPRTNDERAEAKADNLDAIKQAQAEIDQCEEDLNRDDEARARMAVSVGELEKGVPLANVELMREHYDEFVKLFAAGE
jgi:hypothetical protein